MLFKTSILLLLLISCNTGHPIKTANETIKKDDSTIIESLPHIEDTLEIIRFLKQSYNLEVDEVGEKYDSILNSQFIKLEGRNEKLIFIEYSYGNGCMAAYPWKYQLFIEPTSGKLISCKSFNTYRFLMINNSNYLMGTQVTGKGNGTHSLYQFRNDSLINILSPNIDGIPTCDAYSSDVGYYPNNELSYQIIDLNNDGYQDISFNGKRTIFRTRINDNEWSEIELENEFTIDIQLNYIFNSELMIFEQQMNYLEKYKDYYN